MPVGYRHRMVGEISPEPMVPPSSPSADVRSTAEQAALLPRPGSVGDAFLGLLVLLALLGAGFLLAGGAGRAVELLAATAAMAAGYTASWRAGRFIAVGGIVAFLALELRYGRLDSRHYWIDALFAAAIGCGVLAAAYIRLTGEQRRIGLLDAQAALEARDAAESTGIGVRGLPPLDYELERARRHNHQVSLLVLRLDDVEDVEVRFGGAGLHTVHERIERVLARQLRATDVALRDGRFDHWVILPQTPAFDARVAAERLRLALAAESVEFAPGELMNLSIAVGIASFPDDGATNDEVVKAARRAYGRALELGGNRSVLHSAVEHAPPGWALTADASP